MMRKKDKFGISKFFLSHFKTIYNNTDPIFFAIQSITYEFKNAF